ncbi:MAG: universal stress protein [Sulfurovum sp.]|nr:universal stress protein [Sulfurovum sp.]
MHPQKGRYEMSNSGRIVVGIDPFAKSETIVKRAFMVARERGAELFFVYAVKIPWFETPDLFRLKNESIDTDTIRQDMQKMIKKLKLPEGVPYSLLVKEGDPEETILYQAKLIKAEMIIIGPHRKGKKALFGTTAHKIAHRSHIPVLVVKGRSEEPYREVTVLTDFGMHSKWGARYAKKTFSSAKMKIVHAYEPFYAAGIYTSNGYGFQGFDSEKYRQEVKLSAQESLNAFKSDLGVEKTQLIEGGIEVRRTLLDYVKKNPCDLLVIGSRGTSGFQAILGSMASYLLAEAPCDVLVYVLSE